MNVQARKIKGSNYSEADILEVLLDYDKSIEYVLISHSIEMVSGKRVTHGGGAEAEEYLHYKETPEDGTIIDYSSVNMEVVQVEKGESVIKVLASYLLKSEQDAFIVAYTAWEEEEESDEKDPVGPIFPSAHIIKTGNITLDFQDDVFV